MLIGKNIYKRFGDHSVLEEVSIELKPGTITVVAGPSGAGKTTLLNCLSLLTDPDSGSISFNGQPINFPTEKQHHIKPYPTVTVVFQKLFLFPHLSNKENVLFGIDSPNDQQMQRFEQIVDELEMRDFINKRTYQSSLGQSQRVAIARALMVNPKYILLDEVTASLDKVQISNILNVLLKLKEKDIGLMMITHDPEIARFIADEIVFLDNGKIVEIGDNNLFQNPKSNGLKNFLNKIIY